MLNNTISQNQIKSKRTAATILKELFIYYKEREKKLVYLAYQKGATQLDVAHALNVDPALITRNYPKGGKK